MAAQEANAVINHLTDAQRQRFRPPLRVVLDSAAIESLTQAGIQNWKQLFTNFFNAEVQLLYSGCLEPQFHFAEGRGLEICLHPDRLEHLDCLEFTFGDFNAKCYIFGTTPANQDRFDEVYNLPVVVCNAEGTLAMKEPTAVQALAGNPVQSRAELKRMNNQVKRGKLKNRRG